MERQREGAEGKGKDQRRPGEAVPMQNVRGAFGGRLQNSASRAQGKLQPSSAEQGPARTCWDHLRTLTEQRLALRPNYLNLIHACLQLFSCMTPNQLLYLLMFPKGCIHSTTLSPKSMGRFSLGLEIRGWESTVSRD